MNLFLIHSHCFHTILCKDLTEAEIATIRKLLDEISGHDDYAGYYPQNQTRYSKIIEIVGASRILKYTIIS
jgi:hypothetical protein